MRTTIDLPDDLYRTLKVRAGMSGLSLKQLVQQLIEQGMRSPRAKPSEGRHAPPPVIISPRGVAIPALSGEEIRRIEEEEDEAKHAGPA
jgi:plasmid stability protein